MATTYDTKTIGQLSTFGGTVDPAADRLLFWDASAELMYSVSPAALLSFVEIPFTQLDDVPSSYTGQTTKTVIVNAAENGLIFAERREVLTADRSYYVATTGDDANDGLTALTPFLTIQKAIDVASALDLSIYRVTINVADGTYSGGTLVFNKEILGGLGIDLVGNSAAPGNVILNFSIAFQVAATIRVGGFNFAAARALRVTTKTANVEVNLPCIFSGGNNHIEQRNGGQFRISADYEIVNNFSRHLYCERHAQLIVNSSVTVTVTGTPAIAGAYAVVNDLSYVNYTPVIVGGATGTRYDVNTNGILNVNGAGATYLPGDVAGTTGTQGQYI